MAGRGVFLGIAMGMLEISVAFDRSSACWEGSVLKVRSVQAQRFRRFPCPKLTT